MAAPIVRLEDMKWLGGRPAAPRQAPAPELEAVRARGLRIHDPGYFKGRKGYSAAFIPKLRVPLPRTVGRAQGDEAPVAGGGHVLRFTHFSSVVSKSRRVPLFTACNIDGKAAVKIKRTDTDTWFFDGRLALEHQIGEELYEGNILDRGHLVRREDPVWGKDARVGNDDTFHFTNCAPQAGAMNQRTWLGLEDYILQNARAHELKACVFTGPVLRDDDQLYRGVRIPREFWKVVVIRTPERPSATAYLVSQAKQLAELEFAFGQYKTYQVSVREIESLAGLDFGTLSRFDGFSNPGPLESARLPRAELGGWKDIRI